MKNSIQKFGKFLSSMVMPNIGALIAFGFLAALFIDTGWLPNKQLSTLVGPMLTYLIPVLIASTGGYLVAGERGRVIGAIAVVGAILSDLNITMPMGAMIMGGPACNGFHYGNTLLRCIYLGTAQFAAINCCIHRTSQGSLLEQRY